MKAGTSLATLRLENYFFAQCPKTVWPSCLKRWLQAPVRKGVGSNPTAVTLVFTCRHVFECKWIQSRSVAHAWIHTTHVNSHACIATSEQVGLQRWHVFSIARRCMYPCLIAKRIWLVHREVDFPACEEHIPIAPNLAMYELATCVDA